MKVVILAGGFGTRISEESHLKPKPMIEIGEKPILWHIMKYYSQFGYNEFIICLDLKENVITYDALVCGDRHGRIPEKSNLCCCRFLHGTGKIYFSCNVIAIKITVCDGDSCFRDGNRFTAAVIIKGKS